MIVARRARTGVLLVAGALGPAIACRSAGSKSSDGTSSKAGASVTKVQPSAAPPAFVASSPPRASAAPPDEASLRLLAPLRPGDALGNAELVAVGAVENGRLPVHVRIAESRGTLEITLRADEGPDPLVVTDRYAIYWHSGGPGTNWLSSSALEEIAVALGRQLRANEQRAPAPSGLTTFVERKRVLERGSVEL